MQVTDVMVAAAVKALRNLPVRDKLNPNGELDELRLREAARRTLTAALAEMWRPIEDAPRDGSEFLGFGGGVDGDKGIQTVRWCERVGCWETPTTSLEDWDNQAEGYSRPTHFMPLPTPPPRGK